MKFKVVIDVENAAFEDSNMGKELARILRYTADTVEGMYGAEKPSGRLLDTNGNVVGKWLFVR